MVARFALPLLLLLPLAGCQPKPPSVVAPPPPEVVVAPPVGVSLTDDFEETGQIISIDAVELRARVSGYLVKKAVLDGAEVAKDQLLYQIDPSPYQASLDRAKAEVRRWEAQVQKAAADVKRNDKLLPNRVISQEEYDLSVAQLRVAEAELEGAKADVRRAELDLAWTEVRAPLAGRIGDCKFSEGDLIPAGGTADSAVLTTLIGTSTVWVSFTAPERVLLEQLAAQRRAGRDDRPEHIRDIKAPVFVGLTTEEGCPHQGFLDFVDNSLDPETGTIRLRGVLDNARRLFAPGMYVRVRLPLGDAAPALIVPETAIGTDQGQKYLLTVDAENQVRRANVVLGKQLRHGPAGEWYRVVSSGLAADVPVIVAGQQRARVGSKVAPKPAAAPGV